MSVCQNIALKEYFIVLMLITCFYEYTMLILVCHCWQLMMLFIENLAIFVLCDIFSQFHFFVWCDTFLSGFYSFCLCLLILY